MSLGSQRRAGPNASGEIEICNRRSHRHAFLLQRFWLPGPRHQQSAVDNFMLHGCFALSCPLRVAGQFHFGDEDKSADRVV